MLQVGRRLLVQITRLNEDKNDLILSEKVAWVSFFPSVLSFIRKANNEINDLSNDVSGEAVPSRRNAIRRNSCQNLTIWSSSQTRG